MGTTEVALPDLGSGVSSGELVAWLVEPGDRVAADQTIAEVETDKSLVEVPAPAPGTVTEMRVDVGAQVAEGDVVAVMDADESAPAESDGAADESAADAAAPDSEATPDAVSGPEEATATSRGDEPESASGRVFAPPRVRRLARELGVDIASVDGTGDGGAVTESDVRAATEKRASGEGEPAAGPREFTGGKAATGRREESEPAPRELSATRPAVYRREDDAKPLAERLERGSDAEVPPTDAEPAASATEPSTLEPREPPSGVAATSSAAEPSPTARSSPATESSPTAEPSPTVPADTGGAGAQTTHHDTVDVTAMQNARERMAAAGVADGEITDLSFAVAAVATALTAVPELNGPIEGGEIDRREDVNVAVAVPTDDGLVEPVVVDADDVGLPALARELAELVERARNGSLSPPETADGTFTVTDFGALGGTYATPSAAATGTAVLALGEVRERPRVHEGEVTARAVLPLSAAVDARAVDGAAAAQFLTEIRRYLNTPELLLIND